MEREKIRLHKFFTVLENVFVGEKLEGKGGYVNLLGIKSKFFAEKIKPELERLVEEVSLKVPGFENELLDKLYDFFHRYFNETGTPFMAVTPYYGSVFDRVYDNRDVKLYWKTSRHYYVKSDRVFRSMEVEVGGFKVFFDTSELEYKKNNEKRRLIYEFESYSKTERRLVLRVLYSERGKQTKVDRIRRKIKEVLGEKKYTSDVPPSGVIEKAIKTFERQERVDYFICKDARKFLREQFDLWMYQYLFGLVGEEGGAPLSERRIQELQLLKKVAYRVIDWVSLFEEELLKIWLKPRFVFNSNYVVTLDRLASRGGLDLIKRILSHPNVKHQIDEWKSLGIVDEDFTVEEVIKKERGREFLSEKFQFLPIDTKYFKDLEGELISLFENIDDELDGWLIKSENFQALNTILEKFRSKVQTVYIDPPFNKEQEADYDYLVDYKDSTWATMLHNRLELARDLLKSTGSIFVRCDYNGNWIVRALLDEVFGKENFVNEIVVSRTKKVFSGVRGFNVGTDSLFFYSRTPDFFFRPLFKERKGGQKWINMHSPGERKPPERVIMGKLLYPPKGRHWTFVQEKINELEKQGRIRINEDVEYVDILGNVVKGMPQYLTSKKEMLDSNWTDIPGYSQGHGFSTENSEALLKRVLESTSSDGDLVMDFFLGSGTTVAVAHKLGRKWIGVEMGEHFYTVVLPRMKKVLFYDSSGISKDKDVKERYDRKRAGGFFKYFELEQYEEILRTVRYRDVEEECKEFPESCLFSIDRKLLLSLEEKDGKVYFRYDGLYPGKEIDIAETLSLVKGKRIKKLLKDKVVFEDGSTVEIGDGKVELPEVERCLWWR